MIRVGNRIRGFTLIELIVVIAVIGILATITAMGFSRYQVETRDTRRESSASVIAEALEKYYDTNGEYPSCKAITDVPDTVSSSTLGGIDATILSAPNAASGVNSITCGAITTSSPDSFGYIGDGSATCTDLSTGVSCITFELQFKDETNGAIASIKSRRNTDINTSGALALNGNSPSYTTIALAWNTIPNVVTYSITQSNDSNFATGVQTYTSSTNAYTATGLTPNTTYYYKVQASAAAGVSDTSNTLAATTIHIGKPVLSLSVTSASSVTASWPKPSNTDSTTTYTLQRATSNTFSTGLVTVAGITGTSYVSGGLSTGITYYFRVQAIATTDTSSMSDVKNISTAPGQPTGVVATTNSATQISVSWNATSGASSYTLEYSLASNFTSPTSISGITTTSRAVTGLSQGTTYYFRVYAVSAGIAGAPSASDSSTTTINAPTGVVATTNSATQISVSWNAASGASSYKLEYSRASNFTSPTSISGITTTSRAVTGLSQGTTYYFRVYAVTAATASAPSASDSAQTGVSAPTCSTTTLNSNTQITPDWGSSTGATSYTVQYGPGNYNTEITGITTTYKALSVNNGTTYTSRVQAVAGSASSSWTNCPNQTTGVNGPSSRGWTVRAYAVRDSSSVTWMPGQYPGSGSWWTNGMYIYGTCSPGATVVTRLYAYYAYSNNTSQNNGVLLDWTWNNQDRYMVGGSDSWYVFWQGWVACQVGSTRSNWTYLGNAGGY